MDDLDRKIQGVMPRYGTACDQCETDRIDLKAARQRVAEFMI